MKSTTEERLIDLVFLAMLIAAIVMSCFDARAETPELDAYRKCLEKNMHYSGYSINAVNCIDPASELAKQIYKDEAPLKLEDVYNIRNDASCLMVPCYVNHDKGGDFDFAPMNKYGHILVDCSCNKNPPKGIFLLGVYYYKCATKEEKSSAISCKQFAFKIKDVK